MNLPEVVNKLRRRGAQLGDQALALAGRRLRPPPPVPPWDGHPRVALLTVNFHTTRWLKMMLLTLAEQSALDRLHRLVIIDNGSGDGGGPFLSTLANRLANGTLVRNRRRTHHARGMRLGLSALTEAERGLADEQKCNLVLFVDPDVLFLRPDALEAVLACFGDDTVSHAGQLRTHLRPVPEAQASFLAVRRDWLQRHDVSPWVNHGSPAWWLQRDLVRAGGKAADFPGYRQGYLLHRGRSAVAATRAYAPHNAYATAARHAPHYMEVPGGAQRWAAQEARLEEWLGKARETQLVEQLAERLGGRGVRANS